MKAAAYWVDKYHLAPHPEGGYYVETYRASEYIQQEALPERFSGSRCFSTGIYFLLEGHNFSAFHRIQSDEMWHFYAGQALEIYVIDPVDGGLTTILLGDDPDKGETFQAVVPAGSWFASRPARGSEYALVGCTVAPGFDFTDFEMAERDELIALYPKHAQLVTELTRVL